MDRSRNSDRSDRSEQSERLGWFDELYTSAAGDEAAVPWARRAPNLLLLDWLQTAGVASHGESALVVGCGLGDDAEELARAGFAVTAIDISPTAIDWCRRRFPDSSVAYRVVDLFAAPEPMHRAFSFVLESYTLQALPAEIRPDAMRRIADFVTAGGRLLVICRGRESDEPADHIPQPLTRVELRVFAEAALIEVGFDDIRGSIETPRHFRVEYRRAAG